jgi:hypothetical protein
MKRKKPGRQDAGVSSAGVERAVIGLFPKAAASYFHPPTSVSQMPKSEASLDLSSSSSEASYDSDEDLRLAQKEWEESLEQLQQLVSVVLLPFIGKWLGRRWSQWGASSMMLILNHLLRSYGFSSFCTLFATGIREIILSGDTRVIMS